MRRAGQLLAVLDRALAHLQKGRANPRAAEWAETRAAELLDARAGTRAAVRGLVVEALERGQGQRWLQGELEALGFTPERAELVARTERQAAIEGARVEGWDEAQAEERLSEEATKIWEVRSVEPCPICRPLDGQEQFVGLPFDTAVGPLDGPPAHPGCRCRARLGHR